MSGSLLFGGPEILDDHRQKQSDTGRYHQADETIQIGEQRGLLVQKRVQLVLRSMGRLDGRITGMDKGTGHLLEPRLISRVYRSQMLGQDTLVKLRPLGEHRIGKGDAKTAALVAKQVGEAASLVVFLWRQIRISDLGNRNDQKSEAEPLQHSSPGENAVIGMQIELSEVPHRHRQEKESDADQPFRADDRGKAHDKR